MTTPFLAHEIMKRFPKFELSYETDAHKKVPDTYDACISIIQGKKAFAWFTFSGKDDVCLILELNRERKIGTVTQADIGLSVTPALAQGTIFYGTLVDDGAALVIEDVFFYQGVSLKSCVFSQKLGMMQHFFNGWKNSGAFRLYIAEICEPGAIPTKYPYHHLQYRSLNKIVPYLNVTKEMAKNSIIGATASASESVGASDVNLANELLIPPKNLNFAKPQYRETTVFRIKADVQFDIYHLYAFGKQSSLVYCGVAYIPDMKTSFFMNGLFRNIKENRNLDYIEESDDEDDFQDTRTDKYVDLSKMFTMECQFHPKFKRWVPTRVLEQGSKAVVHIQQLVGYNEQTQHTMGQKGSNYQTPHRHQPYRKPQLHRK
jgi:hypothetical protein